MAATDSAHGFVPLVKAATTAQSLNVRSVMDAMDDREYIIPEYQRDSSQWSLAKKSLFIESLINHMTVPPLIVYPEDDENGAEVRHVVDGQQRLTTVREFMQDRFALAAEKDADYADNVGPLIQKKKFSELPPKVKASIKKYTLNLIVLPKALELDLRLEIFRRINQAGVALSAQDLRLATFWEEERVYFIRIVGVYDTRRDGAVRMLAAAKKHFELEHPWKFGGAWEAWWSGRKQSAGQNPSQMFLYYAVARDLAGVATLLESEKAQQQLGVKYNRTTTSVLDLYCAQAKRESEQGSAKLLADFATLKSWFEDFEAWFNLIKGVKVPRISVNSATKIAFFIAGATAAWDDPNEVSERQWELIQCLLTQGPTAIKETIKEDFPQTRGKWPGQRRQIEAVIDIAKHIAAQ